MEFELKDYLHIADRAGLESQGYYFGGTERDPLFVIRKNSEKLIPYQDGNVLAVQMTRYIEKKVVKYTVVPGIVISYKQKLIGDNKDIPVSKVLPINHQILKAEISDLLKINGFQGHITFW